MVTCFLFVLLAGISDLSSGYENYIIENIVRDGFTLWITKAPIGIYLLKDKMIDKDSL